MHKVDKRTTASWKAEAEEAKRVLAELRERTGIHSSMLSELMGMSQPQIWRLLNGHFKRPSRGVRRLVEYAQAGNEYDKKTKGGLGHPRSRRAVIRAALQTWDQTKEGADALVSLLRTVQSFRRGGTGGG